MKVNSGMERRRANGQEVLAAMNELEDGLVELMSQEEIKQARMQEQKAKTKRIAGGRFKWAVVAACSLCLVGGSVVFAASRLSWRIGGSVDPRNPDASYYWVDYMVDQVPADAFGKQVLAVVDGFKEEARKEAESGILHEDGIPRGWVKEFETAKEALDFVGFDGLRETALPDWKVWHITSLGIYGNQEGALTNVGILSHYRTGEREKIDVQTEAEIFTEDWCHDRIGSIGRPFWKEMEDVQGKEYVTANGKTGLIMAPEYDGGGIYWMEGYMVEGEIVYSISLHYNCKEDLEERGLAEDALMKVMRDWMEQF